MGDASDGLLEVEDKAAWRVVAWVQFVKRPFLQPKEMLKSAGAAVVGGTAAVATNEFLGEYIGPSALAIGAGVAHVGRRLWRAWRDRDVKIDDKHKLIADCLEHDDYFPKEERGLRATSYRQINTRISPKKPLNRLLEACGEVLPLAGEIGFLYAVSPSLGVDKFATWWGGNHLYQVGVLSATCLAGNIAGEGVNRLGMICLDVKCVEAAIHDSNLIYGR